MKSFWTSLVGGPAAGQRKFTLDELRELYAVLIKNPVVTESNKALVVETIRAIAEFMIWGDQNEPRIFDYLLENNIMTYLHKILLQPSNRAGEVAKQVLQTLSIIIQNVRSETAVFFLFSNNHVNNIVDLDFDFDDEEVLGFYVTFLKTISLKLNPTTVHFFLIDEAPSAGGSGGGNGEGNSAGGGNGSASGGGGTGRRFPLYSRATRLAHNREGMVRAAVRTITLNVFSVDDPGIHAFVSAPPVSRYFSDVAAYLAEQIQLLDRRMAAAEVSGVQTLAALDSQMAEVEDVLSYCSDTLSIGISSIAQLLAGALWDAIVSPMLLRPLLTPGAAAAAQVPIPNPSAVPLSARAAVAAAAATATGHSRGASWGSGTDSPRGARGAAAPPPRVRPVCSLFVLERFFQLVGYTPLLNQMVLALVCGEPFPVSPTAAAAAAAPGGACSCRRTLLELLSGRQPYPAMLALRLMAAMLGNRHVSRGLLDALGLSTRLRLSTAAGADEGGALGDPRGMLQAAAEQLEAAGTSGASEPWSAAAGAARGGGNSSSSWVAPLTALLTTLYLPSVMKGAAEADAAADGSGGGGERKADGQGGHQQQEGEGEAAAAAAAAAAGEDEEVRQALEGLSLDSELQRLASAAAAAAGGGDGDGPSLGGFGDELLASLVHLLAPPALPILGLWLVGWLLYQLLPAAPPLDAPPDRGPSVPLCDLLPGTVALSTVEAPGAEESPAAAAAAPTAPPAPDAAAAGGSGGGVAWGSEGEDDIYLGSGEESEAAGPTSAPAVSGTSASAAAAASTAAPQSGGASSTSAAAAPPASSAGGSPMPSSASLVGLLGASPARAGADQLDALEAALSTARVFLREHVSGIWCEALGPMISLEWPMAREALQRPLLRASSEALISGPHAYGPAAAVHEMRGDSAGAAGGGAAKGDGLSQSAMAALSAYGATQRVVALVQLKELLYTGSISRVPPIDTLTDAELRQADVQEGFSVDLHPAASIPAVVSFTPGVERRVFFSIAGVAMRRADSTSGGGGDHAALRSLPVTVVADPSPSKNGHGVVLSVAPLLGADPWVDKNVPKWMHVHVRPSVRGLLRVLKAAASKKGGLLQSMRQLADGHWVLAFADGDRSAAAKQLVHQHAVTLRAAYSRHLAPLTGEALQSAGGSSAVPTAAPAAAAQGEEGASAAAAASAGEE